MAYLERQKQKRGCKGVDFGGKPHLLDAMRILKYIWEDDEGKYARVDEIKRCWRKANILPVSWECDINNDVGRSRVPISMKTLNKDDCDNICDLLEQLSVKAKESGVNVSREAHGLKGSLVSDGSFTKAEMRAMAENWINVEDDRNIIDAEVDDAIELLENATLFSDEIYNGALIDDDNEPEELMHITQNVPVPSFQNAESSVDVLHNYCEGAKVPTETRFLLDRFAQQIRAHRLSIPKTSPTIDSFFGKKPKPN